MDYQAAQPITMCTSKVTLAAGTTTTFSNTGTILYSIKGKAYSKSAMSNAAAPTTDYATGAAFVPVPANYGSVYLVGLDHSGNLKIVQGTVTALDGSGNFTVAPQFGPVPADFCPIGYLVVKAGATASSSPGYQIGTTNHNATGITETYVDLMGLPDRPQVS
jgi:hypothetical protein